MTGVVLGTMNSNGSILAGVDRLTFLNNKRAGFGFFLIGLGVGLFVFGL